MPFVSDRPLDSYFHEAAVHRAMRRIADDAGDAGVKATRRHTPTVTRKLLESIRRGPVLLHGGIGGTRGYGVKIFTDVDYAPDVEWNTRPHDIPGAFGRPLPFGVGGQFSGKFHPGTTGQHMFELGAAELDSQIRVVAAPALEVFVREVVR